MTPDFCVEALQEALGKYGKPEIFNRTRVPSLPAGNGSTRSRLPESRSAWIARDGGSFIERLWRSVKYENIYFLRAYETGTQQRRGLTEYFDFYNTRRTHRAGAGLPVPGRR